MGTAQSTKIPQSLLRKSEYFDYEIVMCSAKKPGNLEGLRLILWVILLAFLAISVKVG